MANPEHLVKIKQGVEVWNQWREKNPKIKPDLSGAVLGGAYLAGANLSGAALWLADLKGAYLERANLFRANLIGAMLGGADLREANLEGANLKQAKLEGANLRGANLAGANLRGANLEGADIRGANLERANLERANLAGADLIWAKLGEAYLEEANLGGVNLYEADLSGADLAMADLRGANLRGADLKEARFFGAGLEGAELRGCKISEADFTGVRLQGADFSRAIVDGETLICYCGIDKKTKFEGVGLGNIRIYPAERQLLEYNIRRMNWEQWYKKQKILRWPVRAFWAMSDYGRSTKRIIGTFIIMSLFFAMVYANAGCWWPPGFVDDLIVEPHEPLWHYWILAYCRPIYFSVVTMTTLGFGDMYANANSIWGHVLLTVQVLLGYVLLGSLITRFAVLFQAGGPAGEFTPMDEKTKELLVEIEKEKQEGLKQLRKAKGE